MIKFHEVFIVPGNHEYYDGYDVGNHEAPFKKAIRTNVHYINNMVQHIDGVDFFFTTLWPELDPACVPFIVNEMNDFYKIRHKFEKLNASGYNRIHNVAKIFLIDALKKSKAKRKVVVSHHVPTQLCIPEEYVGSMLNSEFVNSLGELIENNFIDYSLYGHHHRNLPMVELGKTKLLTNQLGYLRLNESVGFDLGAYFEI